MNRGLLYSKEGSQNAKYNAVRGQEENQKIVFIVYTNILKLFFYYFFSVDPYAYEAQNYMDDYHDES